MELPYTQTVRYQSAANIRLVSYGVRHCLTKLKIHHQGSKLPATDSHLVCNVSSDQFVIT